MVSYFNSSQACASSGAAFNMPCVASSGSNGLPFSMPIDFNGSIIALSRVEPWLALHEAVERLEEAKVVRDRRIVDDAERVEEDGLGRIGRLAERIELDPLAVRHSRFDVGVAPALQDRAQQRIALIVGGRQRRYSRPATFSL